MQDLKKIQKQKALTNAKKRENSATTICILRCVNMQLR